MKEKPKKIKTVIRYRGHIEKREGQYVFVPDEPRPLLNIMDIWFPYKEAW